MSDLITTSLPVLPLQGGIVFPHMVITLRVESDAAKSALAASESTNGRLVLIPMVDGEYAAVDAITGKKLWSFKFNGSPVSNPVASADRIFVGTGSELVAIDPENGEIDWTMEVPDVVQQTPRLTADCLYLICGSSSLCAVEIK